MTAWELPPALLEEAQEREPAYAHWLDALPARCAELCAEWDLARDGEAMHGSSALVLPVRSRQGRAVLKMGFPHPEAEHEALGLQRWGGRGAVRLLRADPHRWALLLVRLDGPDLGDEWDVSACERVGELYGLLHVPALPQLQALGDVVLDWVARLQRDAAAGGVPVPRRLVEQCRALAENLLADPSSGATMIHGDLHYANVLADGDRWVAIDPKPMAGDRHFEPYPMLRNRFAELGTVPGDSVRDGLRRRFHTLIDAAALDEDRARDWVIVRAVLDAHWCHDDHDAVTRAITIAKAVQG